MDHGKFVTSNIINMFAFNEGVKIGKRGAQVFANNMTVESHWKAMLQNALVSRAIDADTMFCGGSLVWGNEETAYQFDEYDKLVNNSMGAYRRAGGMVMNLNDFFWNNHERMFGSNQNETCWHIKHSPQVTSEMTFLYFDTRYVTRFFQDYETGEQLDEERYMDTNYPQTAGLVLGSALDAIL